MIPQSSPLASYQACRREIDEAIRRVCSSGSYINGPEVDSFQTEFASYLGLSHGIGVGNGTDAIRIALLACNIGHGDEVITVSHTAVATVSAIEQTGAAPVLVDIQADTFTLDPKKIESAISPKTRAIVVVHLYGHPAEMSEILAIAKRHRLRVIEDCCQAHGALYQGRKVGTFGDLGCFSFYPTKNLGGLGDGGMVVTQDGSLAHRCLQLREYGWRERAISEFPGVNSRLDEVQAAILRVKLKYLDRGNASRTRIAALYSTLLGGTAIKTPLVLGDCVPAFHLYVVLSEHRNSLREYLKERGIGTAVHYPLPIHQQPAYLALGKGRDLTVSEKISQQALSLPMYPELLLEAVRETALAIQEWSHI